MRNRKRSRRLRFWICALLILAVGVFAVGKGYRMVMESIFPLRYTDEILYEAQQNSLDPNLVCAVIRTESNFDSQAVSHADAHGLMQITPDTFSWLQTKLEDGDSYTQEDIYRPEVNIRFGCWFLRYLLDRYDGVLETALCAYNAGPGRVDQWLEDPQYSQDGLHLDTIPYKEPEKYVSTVLKYYQIYKDLYDLNGGTYDGKQT